jgi:signal transduction histidine kinase
VVRGIDMNKKHTDALRTKCVVLSETNMIEKSTENIEAKEDAHEINSVHIRKIAELKKINEALMKENAQLKARIEKLKAYMTEREQLEAALRASEELYRARFEESPISLWDKDYSQIRKYIDELRDRGVEDFKQYFEEHPEELEYCATLIRVTDVNETTVKIYGAKDKEDFKNNLHKIFCDETWECFKQEVLYVADDKNKREAETVTKRFNGEKNYISVKWQIPRDYNGEPYSRILFSIVDITEQKRAEQEAKFMQAKLIHSNKMASLGTLVSGVAHEINNPNHYIMSNAELLRKIWNDVWKILKDKNLDNCEMNLGGFPVAEIEGVTEKLFAGIDDGARRVQTIVRNLKNYSRPENANLNGRVNINEVCRSACSLLQPQIRKYTDNFRITYEEDIPPVRGSAQQIEQIVINLVMNSLQALPERKCMVLVSTYLDTISGWSVIEVMDEGVGIDPDNLKSITEPFFTTKLDQGGTGLGLFISHAIAKEHGGCLEFESRQGHGTIAYLKLPIHQPEC